MISLGIKIEDGKITDSFNYEDTNLAEVGTAIVRLEQIKSILLGIEFESDLEIRKK